MDAAEDADKCGWVRAVCGCFSADFAEAVLPRRARRVRQRSIGIAAKEHKERKAGRLSAFLRPLAANGASKFNPKTGLGSTPAPGVAGGARRPAFYVHMMVIELGTSPS